MRSGRKSDANSNTALIEFGDGDRITLLGSADTLTDANIISQAEANSCVDVDDEPSRMVLSTSSSSFQYAGQDSGLTAGSVNSNCPAVNPNNSDRSDQKAGVGPVGGLADGCDDGHGFGP